jgi:hypothetical protein
MRVMRCAAERCTRDRRFRVFTMLERFAAPPSCTNPANAARDGPGATIEHKNEEGRDEQAEQ